MVKFWNAEDNRRRMLSRFLLAVPVLVAAAGANTAAVAAPAKGLEFTISGPAFSQPARFVVPAATENLTFLLNRDVFKFMAALNPPVVSVDGKHRLNTFILGTKPGEVGTHTETSGLTSMTFSFTTDADTAAKQTFSVKFKYSRGTTLPAQITLERYDLKSRASGTFSGKAQRTNSKLKDQIYQISGRLDVGD